MSNDEAYVRSVWEFAQLEKPNLVVPREDFCWILLGELVPNSTRGHVVCHTVDAYETGEAAAWAEASEFTRERREQVRQLREEIRFVCEADYSGADGEVTEQAEAAQKRTIARLESALATLTQGMKPDVQP